MTGDEQSAYGLWQVMPPAPLRGPKSPVVEVSVLNVDKHLFQRGVPPVAVDGDPAVAEVRVLGQYAFVSSEMLNHHIRLAPVIEAMMDGRPLPVSRRAVEHRKDRAALARMRYDRVLMAARQRPDPAIERMLVPHRPATHDGCGVLARPWCVICGSEFDYPCDFVHLVVDAIDFDID